MNVSCHVVAVRPTIRAAPVATHNALVLWRRLCMASIVRIITFHLFFSYYFCAYTLESRARAQGWWCMGRPSLTHTTPMSPDSWDKAERGSSKVALKFSTPKYSSIRVPVSDGIFPQTSHQKFHHIYKQVQYKIIRVAYVFFPDLHRRGSFVLLLNSPLP